MQRNSLVKTVPGHTLDIDDPKSPINGYIILYENYFDWHSVKSSIELNY